MEKKISIEEVALMILKAKAVEIRDVDAGEEPFLYASGNWGPGYISIKGLVGRKRIMKTLTHQLALRVAERVPRVDFILSSIDIDFVAGNVTGGMIPGWLLSEELEKISGKTMPFVYIRGLRKKGGQKELITGIANNPEIRPGANGLVIEELVNFAETTRNGVIALRGKGYKATHAATILFYDNPVAIKALEEHEIEMIYLLTLPELLEVAEKHHTGPQKAIDGYREFLADPLGWQVKRGLKPVKEGGTR
ncbi:hypothetical protein KJA15_02730 [Patescibacteria group bacterium]|nr:hypothetical protein [Patescibacteria group bacterium]